MSLQVSYKKQFLFGILMLLVILLSVEGVLRIVDYYNPNCNFMNSSAFDGVEQDLKRKICLDNDSLKWNATPYLHLEPNQNLETISVNQDGFREAKPRMIIDLGSMQHKVNTHSSARRVLCGL